MVNSDSVVTATLRHPRRRAALRRTDRDRRRPRHRGADPPAVRRHRGLQRPGSLLPTGNAVDVIDGVRGHLRRQRHARGRRQGRPTSAITGYESAPTSSPPTRTSLTGCSPCGWQAGKLMGLGDVHELSVPKTTLVSAPPSTAARSAPARSSRSGCIPRSACSARSPWRPRCCCQAAYRRRARRVPTNNSAPDSSHRRRASRPGTCTSKSTLDTGQDPPRVRSAGRGPHRAQAVRRDRFPCGATDRDQAGHR